jgi:signal transduction histidine kinase
MQLERDADGKPLLTPRSSFAQWRTLVQGHSRPWDDMDQEAARAMLPLNQLLLVRESLALVSQSEGRFRDLVALQSDAYWQTDGQGRLLTMSKTMPAWQGVAVGRMLTELLAGSCDAASLEILAQALAGTTPFRVMRIFGRSPSDQREFELVVSGEPLKDSAGEVTGWHGTTSDVTNEVALVDAVRRVELAELASKAKSKFLSHISHELRTPLNAVMGFTQLMMMENPSDKQLGRLKHVNAAGEWLLTMISDLLDLAQFEAGPVTLELTPVNARAVLEDAIDLVRQGALASKVTMTSNTDRTPAWVHASAKRLKQVLVNLTTNAVKYNRPDGEVRFVIRPDAVAGRTRIEVHDTGPGLTPEQLTHLFRPFDRIGQDGQGVKGTGIGLVITKELMTAMGGTVEFESEVGKGTCVSVILADAQVPPEP